MSGCEHLKHSDIDQVSKAAVQGQGEDMGVKVCPTTSPTLPQPGKGPEGSAPILYQPHRVELKGKWDHFHSEFSTEWLP